MDDIDKWIGVRNEMMLDKLSMGQLHQKLRDELSNTRDKMKFLLTGKEPSVLLMILVILLLKGTKVRR